MKSVLGNTVLAVLVVLAVALLPAKAMDHGQMSSHAHSQSHADTAGSPAVVSASDHHAGAHQAHLVDVTGGSPAMGGCPADPDHGSDCCTTNCVSLMSVTHPATGMVHASVLHDVQGEPTFHGDGAAILDRPPRS